MKTIWELLVSHSQVSYPNSFIRPTSLSSTRSNRLSKSFCVSTATRHCAWSLLRVKGSNKYVPLRDPSKYFLGFKNIYDGPYLPKRSKTMFFGSDPLPHTGPTLARAILPVMVSTRNIIKHGEKRSSHTHIPGIDVHLKPKDSYPSDDTLVSFLQRFAKSQKTTRRLQIIWPGAFS